MRTIILTLLTAAVLAVIGGIAFIQTGIYDVSATSPHWPITYWVMDTVRTRSVRVRAGGITPPAGLDDPAKVIIGTEHFAAHCASCHGAPGVPRGDIAAGLYPKPADLADTAKRYTPGELFWIIKNGIKMSGMPAWSDHSDEEIWGTVAFIEKLPGMSETDYGKLVMQSIMQGGGRHSGMNMDHSTMPGMAPAQPTAKGHAH